MGKNIISDKNFKHQYEKFFKSIVILNLKKTKYVVNKETILIIVNSQKNKYYFFILMCSCSYIFNIYKYVYIYIILYTIVYYYVQNVNIFIKYFGESISEAKRKKKIFVKRSGIEIK